MEARFSSPLHWPRPTTAPAASAATYVYGHVQGTHPLPHHPQAGPGRTVVIAGRLHEEICMSPQEAAQILAHDVSGSDGVTSRPAVAVSWKGERSGPEVDRSWTGTSPLRSTSGPALVRSTTGPVRSSSVHFGLIPRGCPGRTYGSSETRVSRVPGMSR